MKPTNSRRQWRTVGTYRRVDDCIHPSYLPREVPTYPPRYFGYLPVRPVHGEQSRDIPEQARGGVAVPEEIDADGPPLFPSYPVSPKTTDSEWSVARTTDPFYFYCIFHLACCLHGPRLRPTSGQRQGVRTGTCRKETLGDARNPPSRVCCCTSVPNMAAFGKSMIPVTDPQTAVTCGKPPLGAGTRFEAVRRRS